jgi:hypothetical protein
LAVKKATNSQSAPSKEKHVKAILLRTFSKDDSVEQIVKYLSMRLDKTNWVVVLKSLMIFHRCFRDGDNSFIENLKPKSAMVFSLSKFLATSPSTHLYTVFVKKYAKYLEEKVSVVRLLNFQFEKNQDTAVKNLKPPDSFKLISKLQSQLNALLNCKMRSQHVGQNTLIHRTYVLLIKDSLILYQLLNEGIIQLLDLFWKMGKKNAAKVVSIYKLFVKETDALIGLYEIGNRFLTQLPQIKKAETSIIDSLEKHIDKLPADDSDDEDDKKKKGKSKKKEESDDDEDLREDDEEYDDYDNKDKGGKDDDSEEQESSEGEDDEPDDLNNIFSGITIQQPLFNFGPGFGAPMMHNPAQPTYNDKASFIKQISAASDTLNPANNYGGQPANPFGVAFNPPQPSFSVQPLSAPQANPFAANPISNPSINNPNPFGGNAAPHNPFAANPIANPYAVNPSLNPAITGSNPGYGANKNLLNPMVNPNITGSSSGLSMTGANPFSGGMNNNYSASPYNSNITGSSSGGNPFGFSSTPAPSGFSNPNNYGMASNPTVPPGNPYGSGVGYNPNPGAQNPFGSTPAVRNPTNPFL